MITRTAYIEKVKRQLDELNASMSQIEEKAAEARSDVRAAYHEEMVKLRLQSQVALAKLEEIKVSTEDGWENMAVEMDKVRNAFAHAFSYFKPQI